MVLWIYTSSCKRISTMENDLGPTLKFISNVKIMCANMESSTSNINNVVSAKIPESQTMVHKLYDSLDFSLQGVGIIDR